MPGFARNTHFLFENNFAGKIVLTQDSLGRQSPSMLTRRSFFFINRKQKSVSILIPKQLRMKATKFTLRIGATARCDTEPFVYTSGSEQADFMRFCLNPSRNCWSYYRSKARRGNGNCWRSQ